MCNRGYKSDIYEGGHRIPFAARWPRRIPAGTHSDEIVCLTDLLATCAGITGTGLGEGAGEDSYDILPALLGEPLVGTDPRGDRLSGGRRLVRDPPGALEAGGHAEFRRLLQRAPG